MAVVRTLRALSMAAGLALTAALAAGPVQAEAPKVVASIAPVHSLVALVMAGVGMPTLLVPPSASPHTFVLKPSDAKSLQDADVIFWVGENLEGFLRKPLKALPKKAKVVELSQAKGLKLYDVREGGNWEGDTDGDEKHDHGRKPGKTGRRGHDHGRDAHTWLDPRNAQAMVRVIVASLSERDPANRAAYVANGGKTVTRLDVLEKDLHAKLAPVAKVPYLVFHDAYQYFEKRFAMNAVGSITVNPENPPGARRVAELRAKAESLKIACVFAEPQFDPKVVRTIVEGTSVRTGVLDPDGGAGLTPGPELYFRLMNRLADSFTGCLGAR